MNMTQEELASQVSVSRQTIIALEKGNYTPSILLALNIAGFLKHLLKRFSKYHMKNNLKETIVTTALVVIAILLLNPFDFWMPDMIVMAMLAIALVIFGIFASFILREKSADERDDQHKSLAGRNDNEGYEEYLYLFM